MVLKHWFRSSMRMDVTMNSIIITGCTSGLGKAFHDKVTSIAQPQVQYVFLGRNLKRLNQSPQHLYQEIDLLNEIEIDWNELYSSNRPDSITLISNAGLIHPLGAISQDKQGLFRDSIKVNLIAPSELTSSLVLWTRANNIDVKIINISSGAALTAIAGWGAYCMSKSGFKMFLDVVELENTHVEVLHFDPGVIDTNMQKSIRSANAQDFPLVDSFREFEREGKLKSADEVVLELLGLCDLAL